MLTALNLPVVLETSSGDLIEELFIPALQEAVTYDRGVGYFSSGWLQIAARGMLALASRGGHARWITSPILSKTDWEALQQGEAATHDPILRQALARNLADLGRDLEKQTLSALAWMVADNLLEFRLALPIGKLDGDFHDKFGIFTDPEGNRISFSGSYNESIQGTRNYESLKIFSSWNPAFAPLVAYEAERFERLWQNADPNVRVMTLPEAAHAHILQLRTDTRPYPVPSSPQLTTVEAGTPWTRVDRPLRDYQEAAIQAWFDHGCQGFLEMATGTGKTITALAASVRLFEREHRLAVIVAAPYQHLVDQWRDESAGFGYHPILAYASRKSWLNNLNQQIIEFNHAARPFMSVITTHTTFISAAFQQSLARLKGPVLLIADEAHHLGATRSQHQLPPHIPFRLALSATPDRWFDDAGSAVLRAYFGETVFSLPLEQAIGISLTPYYYHPHLIELTVDELQQYQELSEKIAKISNVDADEIQDALKMLLIKRANLLNNAENKFAYLAKLMDQEPDLQYTLFYCTPEQIDRVVELLGVGKSLRIHTFTAQEDMKERRQLLDQFGSGLLQGLVAMRCLDEGVDVPATRTAYILASSSNPREFIQRRGRILRKAAGKEFAVIHDLIATPPLTARLSLDERTFRTEQSIVRRELSRFAEFARVARNKHRALEVIWPLAEYYQLLDI